ncbi:hypothetical protein NKG94_18680 [Micromonospora sp. M12]
MRGHDPRRRPEPVAGCPAGASRRSGRRGRASRGGVPVGRATAATRRTYPVVPGRHRAGRRRPGAGLRRRGPGGHRARLAGTDAGSRLFEYAQHSPWTLYWWQFRSHLAPRSAHLHSSLRLAVALAIARVAAGCCS